MANNSRNNFYYPNHFQNQNKDELPPLLLPLLERISLRDQGIQIIYHKLIKNIFIFVVQLYFFKKIIYFSKITTLNLNKKFKI